MTSTEPTPSFLPNPEIIIGVDEVGRGPLFGRVYAAAVVLPKEMNIDESRNGLIKDSKKFHSKKKINTAADFIKKNALAWAIAYEEPHIIDEINIRRATFRAMHNAIQKILLNYSEIDHRNILLHIDGDGFVPYMIFDKNIGKMQEIQHKTIIGGDAKCAAIAAASILAKVSRDEYITELCTFRPEFSEKYAIHKNMGYGTREHIEGIKKYGYSDLHRRSFVLKNITITNLPEIIVSVAAQPQL